MPSLQEQAAAINNSAPLPVADPWDSFPDAAPDKAPASKVDPFAAFPDAPSEPVKTSPVGDFFGALDSSIFNAPARITEATTGGLASAIEPARSDPVAWENQRQQQLSGLQTALATEPVDRNKSYIQAQIDSLQNASPPQQNVQGAASDQKAADWLRSIATDAAQHQQSMREQFGSTGASATSTSGRIGAAIGQAPDILIPYAGPAIMLAEARQSGYQQAYEQAKASGQPDEQAKAAADDAGNASFYKAAATLPLYGIQGAAVSKLVERVLPLGTPAAVRAAVNIAGHSASNVSASGEIRAASGEPFFSPESLPMDLGFGVLGGKHATADQFRANEARAAVEAETPREVPAPETPQRQDVTPSGGPRDIISPPALNRSESGNKLEAVLEQNEPSVADVNTELQSVKPAVEESPNSRPFVPYVDPALEKQARSEHEAELISQAKDTQSNQGYELLDAIENSGGLPVPGSDTAREYKGELQNALEMSKGGRQVGVKGVFQGKLFRTNAPDPDELATRLRDQGFNVETPNDIFNLLDQRLRTGKPIYGQPELASALYGARVAEHRAADYVPPSGRKFISQEEAGALRDATSRAIDENLNSPEFIASARNLLQETVDPSERHWIVFDKNGEPDQAFSSFPEADQFMRQESLKGSKLVERNPGQPDVVLSHGSSVNEEGSYQEGASRHLYGRPPAESAALETEAAKLSSQHPEAARKLAKELFGKDLSYLSPEQRDHVDYQLWVEGTRIQETPRLRPGEKQGDIFAKHAEDLKLAGEKGVDYGERQRAAETRAAAQERARIEQEGQQQQLFSGPPMPDFMKVSPETHADVTGAVGGFFKPSKFTPFREVLNRWVGTRQKATLQGEAIRDAIKKEQPNVHRQAGISVYREAGGDTDLIKRQLAAAKSLWFKVAAREALRLTPNDVKTASRLDAWYNRKGLRAQANGLIEHLRNNYVNHIWQDSPEARKVAMGSNAGKLNTAFRPSKERIVPSLFEGDQAGLKPKSIVAGELASVYAHSMDRALGDRRFVKDLVNTTAADGRPIGVAQQDAAAAAKQAREEGKPNPYADYKPVRHWAFKGEDYRGDILVHPDYANHIEAAIRPSTIDRPEYAATAAGRLARRAFQKVLSGQGFVKQNMLSIPAFHYAQEGAEAIGHYVNPFVAKPIDPQNPVHVDAMNHGLMVASTHGGEAQWMDGLNASRALLTKIPGIGPGLRVSSDYLFRRYIPSLKMETYKAALNRNMDRFKSDMFSGKMTVDDVKYHTANQVNEAFGNLNYADLGRSENVQKLMRAILLAPDFLEARVRQALHGAAGLIPGQLARAHGEQRMAFWTLAVGQYVLARGLNYLLDDKKLHPELRDAFAVYHNGRRYTMRSVPGDVLEALTDFHKFAMARLSPLIGRTGLEFATGMNYKGQKVTGMDQLRDLASTPIPIGLRNAAARLPGLSKVGDPDKSLGEELVSSGGLKTNRASPIIDAHRIAHDWMRSQPEFKEDTGTYPPSQYARLRNALEDNNQKAALSAYMELLKGADNPNAVVRGFHASMTKPFTKSRQGDMMMMQQLAPADAATVQQAREVRSQILQRWSDLRETPAASVVQQQAAHRSGIKEWLATHQP